jgi:hypothetical protein
MYFNMENPIIYLGPILDIVSIVLPFAFWHAWQAHPSLG